MSNRFPVNAGVQRPFPVAPVPGGYAVTQNVQLISERVAEPRQWVITLSPITLQKGVGVVPWANQIDGVVAITAPAFVAGMGNVPYPSLPAIPFRVALNFGAGGIRNHAEFDYPVGGGTFGITADTLDLLVFNPQGNPVVTIPDANDVPVFGAMMVPGAPMSPSSLTLTDVNGNADNGPGESVLWSVKPYARHVWVSQLHNSGSGGLFNVIFYDASGLPLWNTLRAVDTVRVPVPSGACFMTVVSIAGGQLFRPMWEIELS